MRFRPNGGITVFGLRLVSSDTMATRSLRSGYLLLMSVSGGPIVPGRSPPLIAWQVRQLPLPRSKASFCPSEAADCALAAPEQSVTVTDSDRIWADFLENKAIKCISRALYGLIAWNIGGRRHKGHWPATRTRATRRCG